jgi:hypothetical protein
MLLTTNYLSYTINTGKKNEKTSKQADKTGEITMDATYYEVALARRKGEKHVDVKLPFNVPNYPKHVWVQGIQRINDRHGVIIVPHMKLTKVTERSATGQVSTYMEWSPVKGRYSLYCQQKGDILEGHRNWTARTIRMAFANFSPTGINL